MQETRYLRHKPTGERYAWHELFAAREDFEPWVDAVAPVAGDTTVVAIGAKAAKPKKAGLVAPADDEALSIDASRRLP